uniref:Protein kinase domain-containing protein n=1 Tax=Strongyloides stercoralis TaxID=6248 RepID=A0A0K0DZE7_STRER
MTSNTKYILYYYLLFLLIHQILIISPTGQCIIKPLGMENGEIKDEQLTASSQYDEDSVGPRSSRIRSSIEGGAWCPKTYITKDSYEFLQINLEKLFIIHAIETQGRYSNGTGREYASQYYIDYMRNGSRWIRYKNRSGERLIIGNNDTNTPVYKSLDPPIISSKIRIVPKSDTPRTVCLRIELYGCQYEDGLIFYSYTPDPSKKDFLDFNDRIFEDNDQNDAILLSKRGLGLLSDGIIGTNDESPFSFTQNMGNQKWIGWEDKQSNGMIHFIFEFDKLRIFDMITFYGFGSYISRVDIAFGSDGYNFASKTPITAWQQKVNLEGSVIEYGKAFNFSVALHKSKGRFIKIILLFDGDWFFLSEIKFKSNIYPTTNNISIEKTISEDIMDIKLNNIIQERNYTIVNDLFLNYFTSYHILIFSLIFFMFLAFICGCLLVLFRKNSLKRKKNKNYDSKLFISTNNCTNKKLKSNALITTMTNDGQTKTFICDNPHVENVYVKNNDSRITSRPLTPNTDKYSSNYEYCYKQRSNISSSTEESYNEHSAATIPLLQNSNSTAYSITSPTRKPKPPPRRSGGSSTLSKHSTINDDELHYASSNISIQRQSPETLHPTKHLVINNEDVLFQELIGEGKFTIINRVYIELLKNENDGFYAVKNLKITNNDAAKYALCSEADLLSQISHPNILKFINFNDSLSLILEYCHYGSLRKFVNCERDNINFTILISMCTGIADGMKYLEHKNIVHGHLSPKCCLVDSNWNVKIGSVRGPSHHAQLRYSSPESILLNTWTNKSDVWSYAITIWELIHMFDKIPFDQFTNKMLVDNAQLQLEKDEEAYYLDFDNELLIPPEMIDILKECWNTDMNQRPTFLELHLFLSRKSLNFQKMF